MTNSKFPIETIPDEDTLYHRVHFANIDKKNGKIIPKAFDPTPYTNPDGTVCDKPDGLSVNWSEYSNAEQTKQNAKKTPEKYGVVSFIVQKVREISLEVVHDPDDDNQAHSLIRGIPSRPNDAKITMLLRDMYKWEIQHKNDE